MLLSYAEYLPIAPRVPTFTTITQANKILEAHNHIGKICDGLGKPTGFCHA